MKDVITTEGGRQVHHLVLAEEVSFFNKANIIKALDEIPENSKVVVDATNSKALSYDVVELIKNYEINAKTKNITVEKIGLVEAAY
jgi:MFS superfamily sulfate permease-like transporter